MLAAKETGAANDTWAPVVSNCARWTMSTKSRGAEISILALYRMHEPSDFLPYVILRIADITAEITLHVFGFFAFIVRQIRYFPLHGHHTVALPSRLYVYIDLAHHYSHARRSQTKHLFAVGTFHRFTVLHVVMPIALRHQIPPPRELRPKPRSPHSPA